MHQMKMQHGAWTCHKSACRPRTVLPVRHSTCTVRQLRVQASRRQAQVAEEETQQAEQQEEATGFSAVVQRLLHRAASSLTRGTTTCLSCKGQGTCTCPACHGTGITNKDARQNVMRHTTQKLRSVLGGERSEYHSDWLTSNRCRRCHGAGVMVCPTCQGLGTRHAPGTKPPQ
jgi:DnaJ-class molecular chaperone